MDRNTLDYSCPFFPHVKALPYRYVHFFDLYPHEQDTDSIHHTTESLARQDNYNPTANAGARKSLEESSGSSHFTGSSSRSYGRLFLSC